MDINNFSDWFFIGFEVVNGRLEFSYELGSGPAQITTRERVDDGKRHRVVARRTTRHGSLELDGVRENGISPEGNHQMLNTKGNIYIGKISFLNIFMNPNLVNYIQEYII